LILKIVLKLYFLAETSTSRKLNTTSSTISKFKYLVAVDTISGLFYVIFYYFCLMNLQMPIFSA